MSKSYKILILGASYGSLLGIKLGLAGHTVKLACRADGARLINQEGSIVRFPRRDRTGFIEINSKSVPGEISAAEPGKIDPADYDLAALAMQEPQYGSSGPRELLHAIAKARVPCMSIMNMPPLAYLKRIPGIDVAACRDCYTDPTVWDGFDPALMTLSSPDPQAFRPSPDKRNLLRVGLPTNFKVARFESDVHTAMLRQLATDIDAIRFDDGDGAIELPVKLRVHDSIFVPLAKWSMLMAGNYRCVQKDGACSISEAVHGDLAAAMVVYQWTVSVCLALGADGKDMVPFEKYAKAARSLKVPSSAARAVLAGARNIEHVPKLVQTLAAQKGMRSDAIDEIVSLIDGHLERNRNQNAAMQPA